MKKATPLLLFLLLGQLLSAQSNAFSISGKATDCRNHKPLADVIIKLIGSDGSCVQSITGDSGTYSFPLKPQRAYIVTGEATASTHIAGAKSSNFRYLSDSGKERIDTHDSIHKDHIYNFCLVKDFSCIMRLPCLFFEKNSATNYRYDDNVFDLATLRMIMEDNPTFVIEISGHAASNEKKPQQLAQQRAETICDQAIKMGINPERLVARGYADTKPYTYYDFDIEEQRTADKTDARTRRVVCSIIRKDYLPKSKQDQEKNYNKADADY